MAFVYDIDLAAFSVAEYKEGVVEHIHLQDGFFNLHWLYREAFGFDDLVFVRLIHLLHKVRCEGCGFHPFFQLGFVFDNLTEQGVNDGFQSIFAFISRSFGTEEKTF